MKKWINIDYAPKDWINQDDIPARQLFHGALRVTVLTVIALAALIYMS